MQMTLELKKDTQQKRILELLKSKDEVSLPEIMDLRIGQYNSRIKDLRDQGYDIKNRLKVVNGERLSWYKLWT